MHWQTHGAGHAPPPCSTGGVYGSRNQWTQFSIRLSKTTLCSVQEAPCGVTKMQGSWPPQEHHLTLGLSGHELRPFRHRSSTLLCPSLKFNASSHVGFCEGFCLPLIRLKSLNQANVQMSYIAHRLILSLHSYKNSFFVTLTVHASIKHSYTFY